MSKKILMKQIILLLIVYFSFSSHLCSQKSLNVKYNVVRTDLTLPMTDGVMLDCTKFIPEGITKESSLAAVIFCHGFGGSKNDAIPFAEGLAKLGYYTFTFSMRGQGNSQGYSNLISSTEMNDMLKVIEYVKKEPVTKDDRIALSGSSQGGIISFMAGCSGADVRCIISDLASPEFASDWIENGCVKTTLFWSINYDSSIVRYNDEVKQYRNWILFDSRENWEKLSKSIIKDRDFPDKVSNLKAPIFITNNWQDKFFNALGMLRASQNIKVPFQMNFSAVQGHGSDTSGAEIAFHSKRMNDWLEYWLFDIKNGVADSAKFYYAVSSNPIIFSHWTYTKYSSNVWPPPGTTNIKFYFHPGMKLSMETNETDVDTASFTNDVRDKSLTMLSALYNKFTGNDFNTKFQKNYIFFETKPLEKDLQLTGAPRVNLVYSSSADICQYNFQIWEVTPEGNMNFVTRVNFTDRDYEKNSEKTESFYGQAHSHLFKKGNKIRVYITNIDNGPDDAFLKTNPYVLPILKRAKNFIYMDGSDGSYIEFPVIK